ncbi:MAG: hypothetical protein KatS3mg119_1209 [Rhodothalassiaceae bacterium]|nr:MAG: hypothetical protein KatS3mg119_1209 [Rhodothalassiaceae bacterium]
MKGLFLDEFLTFLEEQHSWRLAEDVSAALGGTVFLWTGDYPAATFDQLIDTAARLSGEQPGQLARRYGRHLFRLLERRFPELVLVPRDGFSFLAQLPARLALKLGIWLDDGRVPGVAVLREGERVVIRLAFAKGHAAGVAEGFLAAAAEKFGDMAIETTRSDEAAGMSFVLRRTTEQAPPRARVVPLRAPVPL